MCLQVSVSLSLSSIFMLLAYYTFNTNNFIIFNFFFQAAVKFFFPFFYCFNICTIFHAVAAEKFQASVDYKHVLFFKSSVGEGVNKNSFYLERQFETFGNKRKKKTYSFRSIFKQKNNWYCITTSR